MCNSSITTESNRFVEKFGCYTPPVVVDVYLYRNVWDEHQHCWVTFRKETFNKPLWSHRLALSVNDKELRANRQIDKYKHAHRYKKWNKIKKLCKKWNDRRNEEKKKGPLFNFNKAVHCPETRSNDLVHFFSCEITLYRKSLNW